MDTHQGEQLTVRLVLLGEPSLWCWEIVDTADGAIVESSWARIGRATSHRPRRCGPGSCGSPP